MKSRMGGLRRAFMNNHLITTQTNSGRITSQEKEENIIHWMTLF